METTTKEFYFNFYAKATLPISAFVNLPSRRNTILYDNSLSIKPMGDSLFVVFPFHNCFPGFFQSTLLCFILQSNKYVGREIGLVKYGWTLAAMR